MSRSSSVLGGWGLAGMKGVILSTTVPNLGALWIIGLESTVVTACLAQMPVISQRWHLPGIMHCSRSSFFCLCWWLECNAHEGKCCVYGANALLRCLEWCLMQGWSPINAGGMDEWRAASKGEEEHKIYYMGTLPGSIGTMHSRGEKGSLCWLPEIRERKSCWGTNVPL